MDVFDRMKNGEEIDMVNDKEYMGEAFKEMQRSRKLCFKANNLEPYSDEIRKVLDELFEGRLPKTSYITPPFDIDRAKCITIGEHVFINHSLDCMSSGGITIEDNVMMGPEVALMTANHNLKNLNILKCKPILIKKGAWIGARAIILPGVTVGEGAVLAGGAVVTKDVEPYTIVGGVPARVIGRRFDAATAEKLLAIKWWNYDEEWLIRHIGCFRVDVSDEVVNDIGKEESSYENKD